MKRNVIYSAMFDAECYPFHVLAERVQVVTRSEQMTDENAVLIVWGGADVDPRFYGHPKSKTCYTSAYRDQAEWDLMQCAIAMGIPIIGVCRGAQLMCAVAGGFLIQDTSNHAGPHHEVTTIDGERFTVNSIHHQMMGLEGTEHELIGWCSSNKSDHYTWKDDKDYPLPDGFKEPEMVWFPKLKGLAIQWHPESMADNCFATRYILETFNAKA